MSSLKVNILDYNPHLVSIELPELKQYMHISRKIFEQHRHNGFYEVLNKARFSNYL